MAYVIGGVILGVFVAVIVVLMKKDAKECSEMVEKLTEAQKKQLMETKEDFSERAAWTQDAIIGKMVEKGDKYNVRLVWYNKVYENNEYQTFTIADASLSKAEQDAHQLKVGDIVKLYIAPEKAESAKIVF